LSKFCNISREERNTLPDYLEVEYSEKKRPKTQYSEKLANHLFKKYGLKQNQDLLEIGSGRAEILKEFNILGLNTYAIDSAETASKYAKDSESDFENIEFNKNEKFNPFNGKKFDVIFTKSFVEHIDDPILFAKTCYDLLKPGGKLITLTPDWERNYAIFYDDLTHVKPFTTESLLQFYEFAGFKNIKIERFMQLPSTWNSKSMFILAKMTSLISPLRSKNKWLRWSRELMISGIGIK